MEIKNKSYKPNKFISRVYSSKVLAMNNVLAYCNKVKETIYVWESNIGPDQKEYVFKTRRDIIMVDSPFIIHVQKYDPTKIRKQLRYVTRNGLRQIIPTDS